MKKTIIATEANGVQLLTPLCRCLLCMANAIVELTPAQRLAQPDDTTHVCHPALGGCNHGFTDDRTRTEQKRARCRVCARPFDDERPVYASSISLGNECRECYETPDEEL